MCQRVTPLRRGRREGSTSKLSDKRGRVTGINFVAKIKRFFFPKRKIYKGEGDRGDGCVLVWMRCGGPLPYGILTPPDMPSSDTAQRGVSSAAFDCEADDAVKNESCRRHRLLSYAEDNLTLRRYRIQVNSDRESPRVYSIEDKMPPGKRSKCHKKFQKKLNRPNVNQNSTG